MIQFLSPHAIATALIIFLFIAVGKWKKRTKTNNQTMLELPPGPKRLPFIGSLHHMRGAFPHRALDNLAKRYGPVMSLQLGEIFAVVVSSPSAVTEILKTHELAFAQRPRLGVVESLSYEYSSFTFSPYGEYWREVRKMCMLEFFSMKRVMSFRPIREQEVWDTINAIGDFDGKPFNLSDLTSSVVHKVITRALLGNRCRYQDEFISLMKEVMLLSGALELPDLFPSMKFLRYMSRVKPALERLHHKVDAILNCVVEDHKGKPESIVNNEDNKRPSAGGDFIDMLLNLQETGDLKFQLTEEVIKNITLELFSAGSESSSIVIEWAMSEMLRNLRVMQKAQLEIRSHLKGKSWVEESDIESLEYLKAVVKETLRLHPTIPLVPREARERCKIMGYDIPSKANIIINSWTLGRDPDSWTRPEEFLPERFLGASVDFKGNSFQYIPFGGGRRICPGINYAIAGIELLLAQLLYHFDWEIGDRKRLPQDLDMEEAFALTLRRKNPLVMIATTRIRFSKSGN